jgi:hypothetical protein
MTLALATSVNDATSSRSGILGLGQDSMSRIGSTLLSRLVMNGVLDQPVLSIRIVKGLSSGGRTIKEGGGDVVFGGIESQYIVGGDNGLTWIPVTSTSYW